MVRLCQSCNENPGNRKCAGCSQAWYCSKECQKDSWLHHKFDCNTKNGPTTADHLAIACLRDLMPTHRQTLIDYGFERAFTGENQGKLLGLYVGLTLYGNISSKMLHRWRKNGTLISEIKNYYERLPSTHRGQYYPWFLQNQWVLDGKTPEEWGMKEAGAKQGEEMMRRAWIHIGRSPTSNFSEINEAIAKWPREKSECFHLYSMLLSGSHPGPGIDAYIAFGFCTCNDPGHEMDLARYYQQLLKSCTFEEFLDAYTSSRLYHLFLEKGIVTKSLLKSLHPHLEDLLALRPSANHSVWNLKEFIELNTDGQKSESYSRPINSVTVDYGFINCKTKEDFDDLTALYETLFKTQAKPPDLHHACIEGKLYEFASKWIKITEKKRYKMLLKNMYPLNDIE